MKKDVAKEFLKLREFTHEETLKLVKMETPEFLAEYIYKINKVYNLLIDKANNRYRAIKDQEKFIIKLDRDIQKYFNMYADESIKNYHLEKKYNKALELLKDYNMPCDIDDFMNKNVDYCSRNCSVDDEVFKECWNRYIEQELENEK